METILEKNKHIKRYATKEEMSKCIDCLAEYLWQDAIREDGRFIDTRAIEQGEAIFKEEVRLDYKDIIGDFGIVDYFPEEDCSVITTSCAQRDSEGLWVDSDSFRFVNEQGIYSCVDDDVECFNFKLSLFIKKTISSLNNTVGRPNRPTDNSISKTINILDAIKTQNVGIDFACKHIELPKSTYYKTLKWLEKNSISILNKKD